MLPQLLVPKYDCFLTGHLGCLSGHPLFVGTIIQIFSDAFLRWFGASILSLYL